MSSIYFKEVNEVLVLSQDNFQCILSVGMSSQSQLLRGGLPRSFLAREEGDQVENLRSILHDHILGEALHSRTLHGVVEPSSDELSVHL